MNLGKILDHLCTALAFSGIVAVGAGLAYMLLWKLPEALLNLLGIINT
jgi:hypothetical protein